MHKFSSIVNSVGVHEFGGARFVRKQYSDVALGTGIEIPIKRKVVEARVLTQLTAIHTPYFSVPNLLHEADCYIDIEYIEGVLLRDSLFERSEATHRDLANRLGRGIAMVERELTLVGEDIFVDLADTQETCAKVLSDLKTPKAERPMGTSRSISLGDVGVNNIILSDESIYLIDFEFCHWALPGRDIGQFTAQLSSLGCRSLADSALAGYQSAGGRINSARVWLENFREYYA